VFEAARVPPTEIPLPVETDVVGWELPILVPLVGDEWLGADTEVTGAAGAVLVGAGRLALGLRRVPPLPPVLAT
jgi:hypothetical protein